jgi:hypothetical protein
MLGAALLGRALAVPRLRQFEMKGCEGARPTTHRPFGMAQT